MKIFEPIYKKTLEWAGHPKAEKILGVVSFAESSFYLIGALFFDAVGQQIIDALQWQDKFDTVKQGFAEYGVWIILIASFTPFPYKIVTISSGIFSVAILPFILLSLVGRGARFFMVCGLVKFFGPSIENMLDKWVERIGWASLVLLVLAAVLYKTFVS